MGITNYIKNMLQRAPDLTNEVEGQKRELEDLRLALARNSTAEERFKEVVQVKRRTLSAPLMYANPRDTDRKGAVYTGPIYDLTEIARALDVEPYVSQSVRKHRETILKEGFEIKGEDTEAVEYIERRLFEMFLVTENTFGSVVREFATNLVQYGTGLILKKRNAEMSTGRYVKRYGKTLQPIAGLFPVDTTTVTVNINDNGYISRYKQTIGNSVQNATVKYFSSDDMIIATIDKKTGFVFGTPLHPTGPRRR